MKKILLLLVLLFSVGLYSQSIYETNIYIPIRTYHFNRTYAKEWYTPTEGGNLGAIIVLRKYDYNKEWFRDYQFGAIRNSFDKLSIVAQIGVGYNGEIANISINAGLISGYGDLYYWNQNVKNTFPYIMEKLGIIPSVSLSVEPNIKLNFNKFELKPLIIITPEFLNGGILIKLK